MGDLQGSESSLSPPINLLESVLRLSYGEEAEPRPVPSAGGLFPLTIHALVRGDGTHHDLLWFDDRCGRLGGCNVSASSPALARLLVRSELVQTALGRGAAVVSLSADLSRIGFKYGTRGGQFALMEAGAVMQRMYESSSALSLGIRAVGGFQTREMMKLLEIDLVPMLLILLVRSAE